MARTNPPYYNEEEDEQTLREDELLSRGMNPDLGNEDDGNAILSGGLNPDRFSVGADGTILSNDDDDFASAWDNLFKAGQGTPLATPAAPTPMVGNVAEAQQRLDEATAKSNEAYSSLQGIANDWMATIEQRREEARPRFTQEELDSRRAKSTALSTLTSALANIANGLTVGAGGLNATVPDGYQAAYEHWNDVQKRHDMRQAEFDKLTDAIYTKKYGMSKADYDRLEAQRKERRAELTQEKNIQYGLDKARITADSNEAIAQGRNESNERIATIKANAPKGRASSGGGGRRSTGGSSSSKAAGNSFSYNGTDYTIPSGANVKSAFTKIANSAIRKLEQSKIGLNPDLDSNAITDINKKITAIREAMNVPGSSLTNTQANTILKALTKAEYDGDDIQGILDGLTTKEEQPKKNTNTNKKAGGASGKGDASKFEMN
jgi:hypothetical protein